MFVRPVVRPILRSARVSHRRPLAFVGRVLLALACVASAFVALPVHAQQKPSVERSVVQFERGNDVVQPPAVVYRTTTRADDLTIQTKETHVGTLMIPRPQELDAIEYRDASLGFAVNLQQAMVVRDGQVVDVPITRSAAEGFVEPSILEEAIVIRPPAADSFDVAVPDGLDCVAALPTGVAYVNADVPCVQEPGAETVIDVRSWFRESMRNALSGIRALPGPTHNARELRGALRSTYHDRGESVRFLLVATAPSSLEVTIATRLDQIAYDLAVDATPVGKEFVFVPQATGFEWITTVGMMRGPNRADLPGVQMDRYRGTRTRGDVVSTLRWNASERERYEVSFFGGTNPTTSSHAVGNHHDVPYGLALAARFGDPTNLALELRAEASYEDDPFQVQTLSQGDQRLRLMLGIDRGTLHVARPGGPPHLADHDGLDYWTMQQTAQRPERQNTHWRLSAGPTYFVDRVNLWEVRSDARQLGYTVDGAFDRLFGDGRIRLLASTSGRLHQSWGYIEDSGNRNLTVEGRASLKPVFSLGNTQLSFGPALYAQHVDNAYAEIPGFSESNLQAGVELTSWISL